MQQQPPLILPRGLILVASVWILASWSLAIGFRPPVEASSASYTPGVQLMLISAAIGLVIGWPMLRLSLGTATYPIKQTVLDLVVLVALVQVVVWPLRLVTPWSPARTAALDATLVAWTVLAGAMVASAVGTRRAGPRNIAIIACMCMCLAGPALAIIGLRIWPIGGLSHRLLQVGPLLEVYTLSHGGRTAPHAAQWMWIVIVAFAAAATWSALSVMVRARSKGATHPDTPATAE